MAKQMYSMRNFSGGINSDMDGRDIKENEFVHMQGFMTDQNGALRPVITSAAHDGLVDEKSLISKTSKSYFSNIDHPSLWIWPKMAILVIISNYN